MLHKVLILLLVGASYTYASKMCGQDKDCADLGDVFCIKSRCEWGLCGCPRGQAMRFLGSEKKFQCVPLRRVGESCSTDGDGGVCGAKNAECIDGKCICDHSDTANPKRWSYWGGERCEQQWRSTSGETCSASFGDTCNLLDGGGSNCKQGDRWWNNNNPSPLDTLPNTCRCPDGQRVALVNDFEDNPFTGNFIPKCVPIKFGEMCLRDADCPGGAGATGMECVSNSCACRTDYKPNFEGTRCGAALTHGQVCYTGGSPVPNSECNGLLGLVCGNVCEVKKFLDPTEEKTCVCDPSWHANGGVCTKVTENTNCQFDYECKSLSPTAVCVEEVCKAGADNVYGNIVLMLGLLLLNRLVYS